jgi:prevent-host-death family protein
MQPRFSEGVIPLSDLKINPGKVVNHVKDSHRPILVTSRGRGISVVQGFDEYEKDIESLLS